MNKYQRTLPSTTVDVYDILHAYEVKSHALGHAIKKLLMAGQRGHKDYAQDLREAVQTIERDIAMSGEGSDEKRAVGGFDPSKWNLGKPLTQGDVCKMFGLPESFFDEGDGDSNAPGVDYTDGNWHEWHGGECPVPGYMVVEVENKWDNGRSIASARLYRWNHLDGGGDIIRFRVVK